MNQPPLLRKPPPVFFMTLRMATFLSTMHASRLSLSHGGDWGYELFVRRVAYQEWQILVCRVNTKNGNTDDYHVNVRFDSQIDIEEYLQEIAGLQPSSTGWIPLENDDLLTSLPPPPPPAPSTT